MPQNRWRQAELEAHLEKQRSVCDRSADALVSSQLGACTPAFLVAKLQFWSDLLGEMARQDDPEALGGFGDACREELDTVPYISTPIAETLHDYAVALGRMVRAKGTERVRLWEIAAGYAGKAAETAKREAGDIELDTKTYEFKPMTPAEAEKQSKQWAEQKRIRRARYNRLLALADEMLQRPALLSAPESSLYRELRTFPPPVVGYFSPAPCPDWVVEKKLERAQEIYEKNMISCLLLLYSASLPWCYLMKNGIPMLYASAKVSKPEFISQRVYETGLFVDGVMSRGGIKLVQDISEEPYRRIEAAVKVLNPKLDFRFGKDFQVLGVTGASAEVPHWDDIAREVERQRTRSFATRPQHFLGGVGVLRAKQVRLLHATMRQMALTPVQVSDLPSSDARATDLNQLIDERHSNDWDTSRGYPINQEDLAYTLLTFSYIIPKGLERWGVPLSRPDKEAFLHLWKVVGHLIGIEEDLLTDDWDEAGFLFETIQRRQAGPSEVGTQLTENLCGVLDAYIPSVFLPRGAVPGLLIQDASGVETAAALLGDQRKAAIRTYRARIAFWLTRNLVLRPSFLVRRILRRLGLWDRLLGPVSAAMGRTFIDGFKDAFERGAFYVPNSLTGGWKRAAGATPEFLRRLHRWRGRLIYTIVAGIAFTYLAGFALLAWMGLGQVLAGDLARTVVKPVGVTALVASVLAVLSVRVALPWFSSKRPHPVASGPGIAGAEPPATRP